MITAKGCLIVQPCGGLCNRMRTVAGAASLAKKLGKELVIIWTRDASLNAYFRDLFSCPTGWRVIECSLSSLKYKFLYHLFKDGLHYKILADKWIYKNARGKEYETWRHLVENQNLYLLASVDILYDGDYRSFVVKEGLLNSLNTICCNKNTIGIHIRRTDNSMSVKCSPTSLFLERAHRELEENPNVFFYLATDDPAEEKKFVKEFSDRILLYHKHSLDRNNPLAVKDALIDLYNLSCCKKIFASYFSSFSDVAALWGGVEKDVVMVGQ